MVPEMSTATFFFEIQIFFVILGHFWVFYPPNSPKNKNIKKIKKKNA